MLPVFCCFSKRRSVQKWGSTHIETFRVIEPRLEALILTVVTVSRNHLSIRPHRQARVMNILAVWRDRLVGWLRNVNSGAFTMRPREECYLVLSDRATTEKLTF